MLVDAKTITYWKQSTNTRLTVDTSPVALEAMLEQNLELSDQYKVAAYPS